MNDRTLRTWARKIAAREASYAELGAALGVSRQRAHQIIVARGLAVPVKRQRCPECRRIFLPTRHGQVFCSEKEGRRYRERAYRTKAALR